MSTSDRIGDEDDGTSPSAATTIPLPVRKKQPRQQLTKGMEHMRSYVVIDESTKDGTPIASTPTELGEDAYGVPASIGPQRHATTSKPTENNPEKRSDPFQFGTRYLEDGDDIFAHNAWDHVQADAQYDAFIAEQTAFQRTHQVSTFDKQRFATAPEKWWDRFYGNNAANFFKDRKWLVQEFPVLGLVTQQVDHGPTTLLEVGAGAGNTAFPLLAMNRNPHLRIHACDYSKKAIEVVRAQPAYTAQPAPAVLQADVWDAAGQELPPGLTPGSVDIILMIFVFSALSPDQWRQVVRNVYALLRPGGEVLFRDYGRGDLAQVRFKKGRYLEENFYVRGDGTRVYFFDEAELRDIWSGEMFARQDEDAQSKHAATGEGATDVTSVEDSGAVEEGAHRDTADTAVGLEILNLAVDRRMLVNRQRKLKMYRCWMQGHFRKRREEANEGVVS